MSVFVVCLVVYQLHRLVFSLRHSNEERKDLDSEGERGARREPKERMKGNNNSYAGKKGSCSHQDKWNKQTLAGRTNSFLFLSVTEEEDTPEESEKLPDISEDPVWKYTVDANALIMMAVAVFMWGYYA